jgi:CDP-paratose 2-epimerase
MKILITGSAGLIGGEAVEYFDKQGHEIIGIDNNMRKEFFGEAGDTSWNLHRIFSNTKHFHHESHDVRDKQSLQMHIFEKFSPFDVVIHCAAQPSHDKSREIPLLDFEVNALGTVNLLELTRLFSPNAVFIFMSTNKVYGDAPNRLPLIEKETRWDFAKQEDEYGIKENCPIDQNTHSIFGASKASADLMVQEYGRYFGMKTCVLRGGCLTGPNHSGVQLHGFLSHLIKCAMTDKKYTIYGYKGKQVRDNIHCHDVIVAMECIIKNPHPGSVYNIGGGRDNSISIIEAISFIEKLLEKKMDLEYLHTNRVGDHICYITDLTKFQLDYPDWKMTYNLNRTIIDIIQSESQRLWWSHRDKIGANCREDFNHILSEKSVVFDVGGYLGDFTDNIYSRSQANIHLFEPILEYANVCKQRFANHNKIIIHPYGLSDKTEDVQIAKMGAESSTFLPGSIKETIRLGDIAGEALLHKGIDLISINVEGGEYSILRRMIETGLVKNCKNIQVQFHTLHSNFEVEYNEIIGLLNRTHIKTYFYPFVWENWQLK